MEAIKFYPVIDARPESKKVIEQIEKDLNNTLNITNNIQEANAILVWWWDWFMLDVLKKYYKQWLPFIWVNCWTLWFLMNQWKDLSLLPGSLWEYDFIEENFLEVEATTKNWQLIKTKCINDIVIGNNILDYIKVDIKQTSNNSTQQNVENIIKQSIKWTWLVITNPIWSTAYWLNLWWPLIPLKSNKWGVMWIAALPFRYKLMDPQELLIEVSSRTPVNIWVDWYGWLIENIEKLIIKPSQDSVKIWFMNSQNFDSRRFDLLQEKL